MVSCHSAVCSVELDGVDMVVVSYMQLHAVHAVHAVVQAPISILIYEHGMYDHSLAASAMQ